MSLPSLSLRQAFSSLQYRNFKLWFFGQLASLIGTWMQMTALGFLMYELTHSAVYLGYLGFTNGIPTLLFTLAGGVISDRIEKRSVLMVTQSAMMALAVLLTALTYFRNIQAWHILLISLGNGIANAFDAPARQAIVRELVPEEDLTNALALNATMFNSAVVLGPAVGGMLYAAFGAATCFGINALSFLAVLVALTMMSLPKKQQKFQHISAFHDVKEGLIYIVNHRIIRTLLFVIAVSNIVGMGYLTLLPAWAVNVLGGNSVTLGFLQAARGFGAFMGAFMIASLGRFQFKGKLLVVGLFLYPFFLFLFGGIHWLPLALLMLVGTGWGFMVMLNMANALIQTHVDDTFRGRVMSVYSIALMGMMPLGSLLFGFFAEVTSEPSTVLAASALGLLFATFVTFRFPHLRRLL